VPVLLETLVDKTALHLMDLTAAVQDDIRRRETGRDARPLKVELAAGKFLLPQLSRTADIVEEWRAGSEALLREGINRHDLRIVVRSGSRLVHGFLSVAEVVAQLWDHLERSGVAAEEVAAAREALAAARGGVLAVKPWLDRLERLTERIPPDIDPALIEQGAEAIRQGRFKTPAEIRQSLRDPTS
jgi:hypothetical protein